MISKKIKKVSILLVRLCQNNFTVLKYKKYLVMCSIIYFSKKNIKIKLKQINMCFVTIFMT